MCHEVQKRCVMDGVDPMKDYLRASVIVPTVLRALKEMSDEYKNRKVMVIHIHDYHKNPEEYF